MRHKKWWVRSAAVGAVMAVALSGCGSSGGGGNADTSKDSLSGATFTVGSKEFTEELVLGQIAIQALEHAGATVKDETGITGTTNVRKALTTGQIDMYWEYTGTGWTTLLGHDAGSAPKESGQLFDAVAKEDKQKNDIVWMPMAEANDTYAIATSKSTADSTGVTTLSDYAKLANDDPKKASLCAASEFLDRADGWPGVEKTYGFKLPKSAITEVDLGIIFTRVPKGSPCKFGEVFSTDGRIPANDMQVLDDDKNFFVHYNVALTVRQSVYGKHSKQLGEIFDPIAEKLTTEELTNLNSEVDVKGLPPKAVAEKWLKDNGFI